MNDTVKWYAFGEFRHDPVTPEVMEDVIREARKRTESIRSLPLCSIISVLDEFAWRLAQDGNPLRLEIMETLPSVIGFSPEMVNAGIELLCDMMKGENIETRLKCDTGDPSMLDMFVYSDDFGGQVRAEPLGVVAHVSAGNVFVSAVDSLLQGLMTKNVNILKMSASDPVFPVLFAGALKDIDAGGVVSGSIAVTPFKGGDTGIEDLLKSRCDAVVVYGGEKTVRAYRQNLGLHTRLVEYGPKYSCAVVDAAAMEKEGIENVADLLAHDVSMWDQSACSSPHTVFVTGSDQAHRLAMELGKALDRWNGMFPHGTIPTDEQVEITRTRELALVAQTLGEAELIIPARNRQDWTVVYEKGSEFRVSCHHRTVYVKPVLDPEQVVDMLRPYGKFVQSVGILAETGTMLDLAEKLSFVGADRITELGAMAKRKHGTPHDGGRGTGELVRWVSVGRKNRFEDEFDYLPDDARDRYTLARLNALLGFCRRHSEFYRERLPVDRLSSIRELGSLPVLSQKDFRDHLPPGGNGLLTSGLANTYTFGSGGTTGRPKFVYRTVPETLRNARALAKGLYLSILDESDVVANLLYAGNMWASFVSYNQALERVGCRILPIAGNFKLEQIMSYFDVFDITAIISIPSVVISIAEYAESRRPDTRIPKIITGGEHLFEGARDYITRVIGAERFASTGYTTNDTGAIGYQCRLCGGGVHHVHEDIHVVEIVDPETCKPVPDGKEGKILVTNIDRRLMPMVRYDVGDMGRIITGKCECGRQTRLMELMGRSDEGFNIGGATLKLDMIAGAIARVDALSYHFRMLAREKGMKDQLVVEVETREPVPGERARALEKDLLETILREKPEHETMIREGNIASTEVRVLPPGTIPRNPRTGKIKQSIDERRVK